MHRIKGARYYVWLSLAGFAACFMCQQLWHLWSYECALWTCAAPRNFSVSEMDIPDTFWHPSSEVIQILDPSASRGAKETRIETVHGPYAANYIILRFGNEVRAHKEYYHSDHDTTFARQEPGVALEFKSTAANEYATRCRNWIIGDVYRCYFVARYSGYYVYFVATIDEYMTIEQYISIIEFLDNRMTCLLRDSCDKLEAV